MSRIREKRTLHSAGWRTWSEDESRGEHSIHHSPGILTRYQYSNDYTSPGPPYVKENDLQLRTTSVRPARWSVTASHTGDRRTSGAIVPGVLPADATMAPPPIGVQAYVTQAIASINPNNPVVDLPLFLFELRELPRMVSDLGRVLSGRARASDIPGGHLAFQFGWAPLFGDLNKLLSLSDEIEKSKERIKKMRETSTVGGKLNSANWSEDGGWTSLSLNNLEYTWVYPRTEYTRQVWFSGRLNPEFGIPDFGESPAADVRRALGLNLSASTLWNAIPWSWLIDYFINVGSYLDATRGQLPFKLDSICIMGKDTQSTSYVEGLSTYRGVSLSDKGRHHTEWKRRFVDLSPSASLAFKSNPLVGRLGILGSLVSAKALRSVGQ